jgi:hypothetical protein
VNVTSNIANMLGFKQLTDLTGSTTYTGSDVAMLCEPAYILLKSDITEGVDSGTVMANNTLDTNILARIQITTIPGGIIFSKQRKENIVWLSSQRNISQLRLYLTYKNNIPIDMNGADFSMKLGLYI